MIEIINALTNDPTEYDASAFRTVINAKFYKTKDNRFFTREPVFYNPDTIETSRELTEEEKFILKTFYRCAEMYAIVYDVHNQHIFKVPIKKLYHAMQKHAMIITPYKKDLTPVRIDGVLVTLKNYSKPHTEEYPIPKYDDVVNGKPTIGFSDVLEELQSALHEDLDYVLACLQKKED